MTKADLVEKVTAQIARTAGPLISKKDCARVVDSFLDAVKAALSEQHNIEIRGFGTFKIRQRKTRMARNPRTGDPVEVAARPVPVFKAQQGLRAMVADASEKVSLVTRCPRKTCPAAPALSPGPRCLWYDRTSPSNRHVSGRGS